MKKLIVFAFITSSLFGISQSHAASQRECLNAIELTKRFEQDSRRAYAAYEQDKSEASKCEFLRISKKQLLHGKKTAELCETYEPELAGKMKADILVGLQRLDTPSNTCNPRSKSDLQAEGRCLAAKKVSDVKEVNFHKTSADYHANKTTPALCTFLAASLEYLTATDKRLRLCEPIQGSGLPSQIEENQNLLRATKDTQRKFCK